MTNKEESDRLGYSHLRKHPDAFGGPQCRQKIPKDFIPLYALQNVLGRLGPIYGPLERRVVREEKETWRLVDWQDIKEGQVVRMVSCEKARCDVNNCWVKEHRHLAGYKVIKTVTTNLGPQIILVRPAEEVNP